MNIEFRKPGYIHLDGQAWKVVERVTNNGRVFVNVIRRKKVKTVRVK